jgi:hypothetical protein
VFGKASTAPVPLADVTQGTGGFALDGEAAYDYSGFSASGAGDVNGDGRPDVVVAAYGADPNGPYSGRTYVVFGKANTDRISLADVTLGIGGFVMDGEGPFEHLGYSASGAGDVNGDGLADVIVGAIGADPNGEWTGRTYVVFGKADTDQVELADVTQGIGGFALDGEPPGERSGWSVSGAGDVNGDGLSDVVVGARGPGPNGVYTGRTYVVFGKSNTDKVELADVGQGSGGFALVGGGGESSGYSVSGAGDVNGDGFADVIVGAPYADPNGGSSGRAYVVFGKTETDAVPLADVRVGTGGFVLDGEAEWAFSGQSVSGAGDLNGDGLSDMIVGSPYAEANGHTSGRAYLVFGKADTEAVSLADVAQGNGGFSMDREALHEYSGISVSGAGDVNGDGLPDLIVGAPGPLSPEVNDPPPGRTYVVFGGDFSCDG